MTNHSMTARGTFEVTMTPQSSNTHDGITESRMSLEKRYLGNLEAQGSGTMLSTMTAVQGSAAYAAMERVAGTLHEPDSGPPRALVQPNDAGRPVQGMPPASR